MKKTNYQNKKTICHPTEVARVLRLGWEITEYYGRIRQHLALDHEHSSRIAETKRRFSYSSGDFHVHQEIDIAYHTILRLAQYLELEQPCEALLKADDVHHHVDQVQKHQLLEKLHVNLENWTEKIWTELQVRSPELGRALTAGGSLADTYWHATLFEKNDKLAINSNTHPEDSLKKSLVYLLNKNRLMYTIERLTEIRDKFPTLAIPVIMHSLKKWAVSEKLSGLTIESQRQICNNLESQVRIWKNILFGRRIAERYLTFYSRSRIRFISATIMILTILLIIGLIFIILLLLMNAGILVSMRFFSDNEIASSQSYPNIAALLAAVAAITAPILTTLTKLFELIKSFYKAVFNWLTIRTIYKRTTCKWNRNID